VTEVDGGTFVRRKDKGVPAIVWTGFNLGKVRNWLDLWAPEATVASVNEEGVLILSSKPTGIPLGWWLYVENGQLGWFNPQSFFRHFDRKS
jgi:hypothetical protein